MEPTLVYYKNKQYYLIERKGTLCKLRTLNGVEERLVESVHVLTPEEQKEKLDKLSYGRHDMWIN